MSQPLGANGSPAQPAEVESIPAQRQSAPDAAIPWLPEPADGDPRPWPTFALTPAQRAIAAPAQAPRTVPVPRAAPPPRAAMGTPAAGVGAPPAPGWPPAAQAPRVAPPNMQPGAPQPQPRPAAPYMGSGYAPNPAPGVAQTPIGVGPRPYVAQPGVSPVLHPPMQVAPPGRGGAQGLAISSLVLGAIGVLVMCGGYGFVLGVPGIITGHMALSRFDPRWAPPTALNLARWGLGVCYTVTVVSLLVLIYNLSRP